METKKRLRNVPNHPDSTPASTNDDDRGHGRRGPHGRGRGHGYVCKICKKSFDTYQALGGHQGIHKKVKLSEVDDDACLLRLSTDVRIASELHQCKTCMKEFPTGQALGGHMRRHRIEKALILMEKERVSRQQVVQKELLCVDHDQDQDQPVGVEKEKCESMLVALGLQRLKAKEDEQHRVTRELALAAKEWRLAIQNDD